MAMRPPYSARVRHDGTITLPYWLFKKGGIFHKKHHVLWQSREDGSVAAEPVDILWLRIRKKPTRVAVHQDPADGGLWAESEAFPTLKVKGGSLLEIKQQMRDAIAKAEEPTSGA